MDEPEKTTTISPPALTGSCACGRISYECIEAPVSGDTTACHCITCRKLSGGPYQVFFHMPERAIILLDNKEGIHYEGFPKDDKGGIKYIRLSDVGQRAFCASCNTPLAMKYRHELEHVSVVLATVDEESIRDDKAKRMLALDVHIFVSQKAWWVDISKDGLPKHERFTGTFESDMLASQKRQ